MIYEPGFYWVRWDRVDGEWTVGELTNYGWNVVGCNISDLRVGKDIIEVGAAIHRQSHSLPGDVGTALAGLEWSEDGYSLRTPHDGDVDGDGRHIVVGGETVITFADSDVGEEYRERIRAALTPSALSSDWIASGIPDDAIEAGIEAWRAADVEMEAREKSANPEDMTDWDEGMIVAAIFKAVSRAMSGDAA